MGNGAIVCDDGDICTADSCDALDGCTHVDANLDCHDDNVCTSDSCQPESGCVNAPVANETACGPGDWCQSGLCIPINQARCADVAGPSGVYPLDPDGEGGSEPFDAYCEMGVDGGGWTLVMSVDTANGIISTFAADIWTTSDEHGDFEERWEVDYKSLAAETVAGTALLLVVRISGNPEGAEPIGWRSWYLSGSKAFNSFFDDPIGSYNANAAGGCNSGHAGDGRKQTAGIKSMGLQADYDTFTGFAQEIYTNSYYGSCESTGDAFRMSSYYRWSNNANVGLGLQMDSSSTGNYSLEAGSHMKFDTYVNPQRYCTASCNTCTAYLDGGFNYTQTLAAIGTDHYQNHCTIGVSYRYEWYVQ